MRRHGYLDRAALNDNVRTPRTHELKTGTLERAHQRRARDNWKMRAQKMIGLRGRRVNFDHDDRGVLGVGGWQIATGGAEVIEHEFDDLTRVFDRFLACAATGVRARECRHDDVEAALIFGLQDHAIAQRHLNHPSFFAARRPPPTSAHCRDGVAERRAVTSAAYGFRKFDRRATLTGATGHPVRISRALTAPAAAHLRTAAAAARTRIPRPPRFAPIGAID